MEKAYKFRLYPNKIQAELINRTIGCTRFIYNRMLSVRIEQYKADRPYISKFDLMKQLPELKQQFDWLREVDSIALQAAVDNMDSAYQNFFRGIRAGKKVGFPRFKAKHRSRASYRTKQGVRVDNKRVKLPKLGWVKAKVSTPVQGCILNATVSRTKSGKYFVSLCCTDVEIPQYESAGAAVGIDAGIKDLVITSDGEKYTNPKYLEKAERKLVQLQRRLSRKPKGSRRRERARLCLARQHEKVTNQRADYLHKLTTKLAREYDIICVENLNVSGMLKNYHLAKAIVDSSWGEFCRQLKYKAAWRHKTVVEVGAFFPGSQLCSKCGAQNPAVKDLAVREWACPVCGVAHDRDINAACNILKEGVRVLQKAA